MTTLPLGFLRTIFGWFPLKDTVNSFNRLSTASVYHRVPPKSKSDDSRFTFLDCTATRTKFNTCHNEIIYIYLSLHICKTEGKKCRLLQGRKILHHYVKAPKLEVRIPRLHR